MNKFQEKILQASIRFMKPIARMMLRSGIGYREFAEVAKTAFVEIATDDYGLRGRKTNVSRVAVMTGLTRKEVKRVRDKIESGPRYILDLKRTPAAEVLHAWHTDPIFLQSDGTPLELPYEGDDSSFVSLVRKYAGDIPPGAVLTELQRGSAVEKVSAGGLKVLKRHFVPYQQDENLVGALETSVQHLLSSIDFNVNPDNSPMKRIERLVSTRRLKTKALPRFRKFARVHITKFAEFADDWLASHEIQDQADPGSTRHAGIGIYYFEED